jgi:putative ABC transport system permease protein
VRRLRAAGRRLAGLFARPDRECELAEEMESHLDLATDDLVRAGLDPAEARRQARLRLEVESTKEACRDRGGVPLLEQAASDVRLAGRLLRKSPVFAVTAVCSLALAIGTNTAIFSLVHGVLLRPFPYPEPERLVRAGYVHSATSSRMRGLAYHDLQRWRAENRGFAELAQYLTTESNLLDAGAVAGPARSVLVTFATPELFTVLGVRPVLGRAFLPEDDRPGGDVHKLVLSHELWQRHFSGDRAVVGRTVRMRNFTYRVVGVMPPLFRFPTHTDLWAPAQSFYAKFSGDARAAERGWGPPVIARLKPGVSPAQALADLEIVAARLERESPRNAGLRPRLVSLRETEAGSLRPYLLRLAAAVVFVLLICCANLSNLMLARSSMRQRELAARRALGATRGRIVRQLLAESLLIALLGGALGMALAWVGVQGLLALIPVDLPFWMRIEVDGVVLAFNLAVSLLACIGFGLLPALHASKGDASDALKGGAQGASGGRGAGRFRDGLVVAQVALALVLLIGAGLMMRSFVRLQQVNLGFEPRGALVAYISPHRTGSDEDQIAAYGAIYRRVLDAMAAHPGVVAMGGAQDIPFSGQDPSRDFVRDRGRLEAEGEEGAPGPGRDVQVQRYVTGPGFFAALGVPLRQGRDFTDADTVQTPRVAVISDRTARTLWPGRNPLGRRFRWWNQWHTVVGVVGDIKNRASEDDAGLGIYLPYTQNVAGSFHFVVRSRGSPAALAGPLRAAIHAAEKETAVIYLRTMEEMVASSLWQRRLWGVLFAVFAGLALLLAAVGIYGVMTYVVAQRTRETGIRMALGAQRSHVLRAFLERAMWLVVLGIAVGLAGAWGTTRLVAQQLFGVAATDAATFGGVSLLLGAVAMLACYLPARRATKVDPMSALRWE